MKTIMKKTRLLVVILTVGLALAALNGNARAVPMLDQQNLSQVGNLVIGGAGNQIVWQTFTVGIAGLLSSVDVQVANFNDVTPTELISLDIFGTSGGVPTGASLATRTLAGPALNETVFRSADLTSAGISVSVGDVLAIRLSSTTPNGYRWLTTNLNPYAGGQTFVFATPLAQPFFDMVFRTFVEPVEPECVVPPLGLVGWWPGDGNANDFVGSNHGTLQNGATFAAGKVGQAFSFDGVNDFVEIPDAPNLKPANVTVDAWVQFNSLDSVATVPGGQYIVFKRNTQYYNFEGYALAKVRLLGDVDRFAFIIASAGGLQVYVVSTTAVVTGQFYHVAATYDGSAIKLYVNGLLEAQTAASFPLDYGNRPVFIGTSGESFFDGKLAGQVDEVEIFNRALTAGEIQAIFNAGAEGKCKNQSPVAQCQNVTTSTSLGVCTAPASVNNGSFDPDGDPITLVQAPPGPYNKGTTNNVALTVTDDQGASDSCTATVTVVDNQAPSITCPAPQTVECTGSSSASATVSAAATDNCPGLIATNCTPGSGTFPLGTTQSTCTATDGSNNSSSCNTSVTVVDTTAPSISCPAAITAECTSPAGAPVTPGAASASDICAGVTVAGPAAGIYPITTTTVSYTATDGVGLQSSCSATIQVVDTTKPVVSCVESVNPSGKKVPKASDTNQDGFYKVSGSDICSTPVIMLGSFAIANGETIKITQTPGKSGVTFVNTMGPEQIKHFQVGPGDAVITATDGSGNSSSVTCLVPPPPK